MRFMIFNLLKKPSTTERLTTAWFRTTLLTQNVR
jgi:hypothetical protein